MDWAYVDRALIMIGLSLFYVVINGLAWSFLPSTELGPYIDREVLAFLQRMNALTVGLWLCFFVMGMRARSVREARPRFISVYVYTWAVHFTLLLYLLGMYHVTHWLLLAAGLMLSLLLLERRDVAIAMVIGIAVCVATTAGERLGWLDYAPIFARPPYDEAGRPVGPWLWVLVANAGLAMLGLWLVAGHLIARWSEREARFRYLSTVDSLTTLPNRRHFIETLEREWRRAERQDTQLSVIVCDADRFKRVNDQYGHAVGDDVLRAFGEILHAAIRSAVDLPGRLGGEEFAILLPETTLEEAKVVAERIRQAAELRGYPSPQGSFRVTMSLGVAARSPSTKKADDLLALADHALYRAKREGRNQVSTHDPSEASPAASLESAST